MAQSMEKQTYNTQKLRLSFDSISTFIPNLLSLPPINGLIQKTTHITIYTKTAKILNTILPKKSPSFLVLYHKNYYNANNYLDKLLQKII